MKVIFTFESPLIIGGRKHSSNFMETDDVIKGSVIRAAFAKQILNQCPEFLNDDIEKTDKMNWVWLRKRKGCTDCRFKTICNKFSDVIFSYFYPKGTEAVPLTSMICKNDDTHGYTDILVNKDRGCIKCENGRVEFRSGLRTIGENKVPYSVGKSIFTKNAIDPYSNTSAEGMLYSVQAVTDTCDGKVVYEGTISGLDREELELFKTLRIGGDTTVGFGKCSMEFAMSNDKKEDIDKLKNFSMNYVNRKENYNYMAVKLLSDALMDFEIDGNRYYTTDDYISLWENSIGLDSSWEISLDKVYTEYSVYRGYDTSDTKCVREEAKVLVSRGTVLVFKSLKDVAYIYQNIKRINGFGDEINNGFGQFEVYYGR